MEFFLQFRDRILPILALLVLGFGMGRKGWIGLGWASTICLYLFSPAQILSGMLNLGSSSVQILPCLVSLFALTATLWALGMVVCRLAGVEADTRQAFLLSVIFMNTGYLGLPICYLAYGKQGFAAGVLYMLCNSLLSNTLGVYWAARGKLTATEALRETAVSPILWSLVVSLVLVACGFTEPAWLFTSIHWVAGGSIPAVLVLLGAQLAVLEGRSEPRLIGLSSLVRLVVSPLLAAVIVRTMGPPGLLGKVFILQSAMPTAVNMSLYALYYDCQPRLVSSTVVFSTIVSMLTLAGVLACLA